NGQGHTVSHLFIDRPSSDNIGLFGTSSPTISDLGLIDCDITGRIVAGSVVGTMSGGSISRCFSSGTLLANSDAGGLAGNINNNVSISDCYSRASVSATTIAAGGLVNNISSGTTVARCYAAGPVSAGSEPAGLIRANFG